jgi:hypothetical protein
VARRPVTDGNGPSAEPAARSRAVGQEGLRLRRLGVLGSVGHRVCPAMPGLPEGRPRPLSWSGPAPSGFRGGPRPAGSRPGSSSSSSAPAALLPVSLISSLLGVSVVVCARTRSRPGHARDGPRRFRCCTER